MAVLSSPRIRPFDDVTPHTLRHSFASIRRRQRQHGSRSSARSWAHARPETTARYAHLSRDPLKNASDAIAERIQSAMGTKRKKAK